MRSHNILLLKFDTITVFLVFTLFILSPVCGYSQDFPCDNPELYFTKVDNKVVSIKYCIIDDEIDYAEIYEPYTKLRNGKKLDIALDDFFDNGKEILTKQKEEKVYRNQELDNYPRFPGCEYIIEEGGSNEEAEACARMKM